MGGANGGCFTIGKWVMLGREGLGSRVATLDDFCVGNLLQTYRYL